MAFSIKRSTYRFAALTLRVSSRRNAPFGTCRCYAWLIFRKGVHSTLFYKTLMLQVRCAHPAGIFAPSQLFELRRCYAWLIFRKEYTVLFSTKRSCFRFAALTLRVSSHRNAPSGRAGVAHGLFLRDSAPRCLWKNVTCFRLAAPCGYRGTEEPHFVEKRKRHNEIEG